MGTTPHPPPHPPGPPSLQVSVEQRSHRAVDSPGAPLLRPWHTSYGTPGAGPGDPVVTGARGAVAARPHALDTGDRSALDPTRWAPGRDRRTGPHPGRRGPIGAFPGITKAPPPPRRGTGPARRRTA